MNTKLTIFLLILTSTQCLSQIKMPHYSEPSTLTQQVGHTSFTLEYVRPKMNDRKIYGGLVPYDKVWRAGASYCTKISFDTEVYIDNKKIPKGKYSLFTIPKQDEWTIILNRDTTLYGSYDYDQGKDVIRLPAKPAITDHWAETFSITIDVVDDKARFQIHWGDVLVPFRIDTRTYANFRDQVLDIIT